MKRILELIQAVSPHNLRQVIGYKKGDEPSKLYRLYQYLRSRKYSEDEVASLLYGATAGRTFTAYRALKSSLTHVLLEAILGDSVTKPTYRTYDEAYEHGHRQLEIVRILVSKRLYTSAREAASQTFRHVADYEIATLNLGLTDLLSILHLGVAYNERLFHKYHKLYVYYSEVVRDQAIITDHYRLIRNHLYANRLSPLEVGDLATKYAEQDRVIQQRYLHVPVIQSMYAQTELTGLMLRGEYQQAIRSAERGTAIMESGKGANLTAISLLALSQIECTIKLRDFDLGLRRIEAARTRVPSGTINDLKIYEHAIRLGLLTKNYDYAYLALAEVQQGKLKELLTQRHREFWSILEAYVHMLIVAGELSVRSHWPSLNRFRLSKFLNEVPVNVRNKRGTNIQILIIQAIILILQGKVDAMIDRTDALSVYSNRYLRSEEDLRNSGFFKLLLHVVNANFRKDKAERKARKTLQVMKEAPQKSHQNDLEIIPYETLWEILVDRLD